MGRELHDTLAQGLAGLTLQIEAVEGHLENANTVRARALIQQAKQRARTTLREARRAIHALRPEILEHSDLRAALGREADQFTASHGIPCEFEASVGSVDPPPETAQDILRFVQEGLSNVARHAQATRATVRIEQGDAEIRVTVADDGIGFGPSAPPGSLGMTGMRERAARLGGELSVQSSIGGGTRVALVMPQAGP
jgi:NarL family two-component system sensor histidine kinase YdfH